MIAGLGYVDEPYPGMLVRGTLMECVESMVELDLEEGTIVGAAVQLHGGVTLAHQLSTRGIS